MRNQVKHMASAGCLMVLATASAYAQHPKLARDLELTNPNSTVDVIVQFRQRPSLAHHSRVLRHGGSMKADLDAVRGGAYRLRAGTLAELADDPEVLYISPDRQLTGTLDITRQAVNAPAAWQAGFTASGVGVAVIDSGVDGRDGLSGSSASSGNLAASGTVATDSVVAIDGATLSASSSSSSQVVYSQTFVGTDSLDHYGHGTHVAGIIAGNGSLSGGKYKGLAPGAKIINLRVLDNLAAGTDSGVIAAIQRAIALKSRYNIRVINLSLGRPVYESYLVDPLCQAVEAAWKAGIVVVVAAGNDGRNNSAGTNGYGTITAPGNDPYVITVGAMKTMGTTQRSDDLVASYSSKGPTLIDHIAKPDLIAPGNRVVSVKLNMDSPLETQYPRNEVNGNYFILSGTSMAAPAVSAAAAILLQKLPNFTPDQVKARLMHTASKTFPATSIATDPITGKVYSSQYDIFTVGAGYLDVAAALADTTVFNGSAVSPVASRNPGTNATSLVCLPASICGSQSLWDNKSMWGNQSLWDNQTVWDTMFFLLGSQSLWDTQSLWATQSLWGAQPLWGASTNNAAESAAIAINGEN